MKLKTIILAGILSTTALTALATENTKDYYVQINAGASYGQKPKGDFSEGTLGSSPIYGFAIGYRIDNNFRTDFSVNYRSGYENDYTTSEVDGDVHSTTTNNIKVKSLVYMANFYYDIDTMNGFTPYVFTGLGFANNSTNNYIQNVIINNETITTVYSKKTTTDFAYKLGLGSKYEINKNFDLDLRYQYANLGKFKTGSSETTDGVSENTKALKGNIKSHEILLGLAYKF